MTRDTYPEPVRVPERAGLMLALDVSTLSGALRLLDRVRDCVDAVKIGSLLLTASDGGIQSIAHIQATGVPVLVDSKLLDVSHIVLSTIRNLASRGATAITLYANCGFAAVAKCVRDCADIDVFLLTALTSSTHSVAAQQVTASLRIARDCGISNVQVPGNYLDLVEEARQTLGDAACIVACGMGTQGGIPGTAQAAGATYEIVGRGVYLAADPRAAVTDWKAALESGDHAR